MLESSVCLVHSILKPCLSGVNIKEALEMLLKYTSFLSLLISLCFVLNHTAWAAEAQSSEPPVFIQFDASPQETQLWTPAAQTPLALWDDTLYFWGEAVKWYDETIPPWYWTGSALVPGLGQVLMEDWPRGFYILGAGLGTLGPAALSGWQLINAYQTTPGDLSIWPLGLALFGLVYLGIWVWSIQDAYEMSKSYRRAWRPTFQSAHQSKLTAHVWTWTLNF